MPPSVHPVDEVLQLPKREALSFQHVRVMYVNGIGPVAPDALRPIFGDGIILTSISAVSLNAFFNRTSREQPEVDTFLAAQAAEHI